MGLDGTVHKTLDEHRDQRVFIYRFGCYTTGKKTSVLGVSVHTTLTLLEFQELRLSPELSLWRFKSLFETGLEDP